MRIITGVAKGRRLVAPDTPTTRPVTDRVREAVFSIIGAWVEGARVLDLYAGSGAFGLEALSRGATAAIFVEQGQHALEALRANIESTSLGGTVVTSSVQDFLERSSASFDLVFIDPPWDMASADLGSDLAELDRLVAPDGEVILSRRHGDETPVSPSRWQVATDRRYGDTRILRYVKEAEAK
ncbi:MAG TPA: 16S rRNA (guanine(966)-N(2))-methyltransferase RsmD [Acidimicrobiia bacterium]|nr:16S rRNA (guanine(966)-N(2))-methyltransferase RsmD [Acidimicrobiia bacterium]